VHPFLVSCCRRSWLGSSRPAIGQRFVGHGPTVVRHEASLLSTAASLSLILFVFVSFSIVCLVSSLLRHIVVRGMCLLGQWSHYIGCGSIVLLPVVVMAIARDDEGPLRSARDRWGRNRRELSSLANCMCL
jgi:hypothetical protein